MRTQNKENYFFWIIAMVAFIIPQIFTAYSVQSVLERLDGPIKIELINGKQ